MYFIISSKSSIFIATATLNTSKLYGTAIVNRSCCYLSLYCKYLLIILQRGNVSTYKLLVLREFVWLNVIDALQNIMMQGATETDYNYHSLLRPCSIGIRFKISINVLYLYVTHHKEHLCGCGYIYLILQDFQSQAFVDFE